MYVKISDIYIVYYRHKTDMHFKRENRDFVFFWYQKNNWNVNLIKETVYM